VSLFERVREEIADELGIGKDSIEMDSRLTELGADSLDKAALVLDLEQEFGIEVPDDDARKLFTVRDVVRYIERELPPAGPA
jgi:acyl carrier protein